MSSILLKTAVRTLFACTGRAKASRQCESALGRYLALARGLSEEDGRRMVEVPWMPGIDEDMRRWSFFMILEHNTIVNRAITANVVQLSRGEDPSGAAIIDVKHDVMPSASAGSEQVDALPVRSGNTSKQSELCLPCAEQKRRCIHSSDHSMPTNGIACSPFTSSCTSGRRGLSSITPHVDKRPEQSSDLRAAPKAARLGILHLTFL